MNKEQVLAVLDDLKSTIYRNRSSEHEAWYQRAEQARAAIVALYEENERLRDEVGCLRDEVDQLEGQVQEIQERME